MNNGDRQRLLHIHRYCQDIARFVERFGKDYTTFVEDRAYLSDSLLETGEDNQ